MSVTAILIDWRPAYLNAPHGPGSLLVTPLGPGTLLQSLQAEVRTAATSLMVLPNFPCEPEYRQAIHAFVPQAHVLERADFSELLQRQEPSDLLLILDARYYSVGGLALQQLLSGAGRRFARHLVHLRQDGQASQEHVVCGSDWRVRAVRRLYAGVTALETAGVSCSVLPVAAARHLEGLAPFALGHARARLAEAGVPAQDLTVEQLTLDLEQEADLLALNEHLTVAATAQRVAGPFREIGPRVWAAPGCRLHPDCRLYGPLVLHAGARIEQDAVAIGPGILGPGACVGRGAVVSQCLLCRDAHVEPDTAIVRRVVPEGARGPQPAEPPARVDGVPALRLRRAAQAGQGPATARRYGTLKRLFDMQAALFGLLVLSPLLLLTAALIKLTSRGPVFYGDEREGRGGKLFRCWKFRTMVVGAHAQQRGLYQHSVIDGPQFKLPNDPRITWLGRILRATNIDELPQLWNVLRGEMSLIGPRPSPFRENQICVPWREARLSVRPGITGLWQICRRERSAGDFHQWIYFDTLYVRHLSLALDMKILLATVLTLGGCRSVPADWMIARRRWQHAALLTPAADRRGGPPPRPAGAVSMN